MTDPKAARNALIVLIKAQRNGISPAAKAKRKKPARWLYPWASERYYAQAYRAWVKPAIEFVHGYLDKHEEAVLRGDGANAVVRQDTVAGESFALMVQALNGWVSAYISDDEDKKLRSPIYMGLGKIADSVFNFNRTQYDKSTKSALGINFPSDESWWSEARKMWQDANYETIRSDIKKYITDIDSATEQAVTNGWSVKTLSEKIAALDTKITKSRANFIARDQIGKLNGTITQKRMQDAGLSMYVWDTSGDERVRESHAVMEGLLCRWDDATVCSYDGGRTWVPRPAGAVLMHPGMDYQCRCCADAYFNELLDEADGVEIGSGYESKVSNISGIQSVSNNEKNENIKVANKFAKSIGIKSADYTGSDIRVVNEMNNALKENLSKFPELKSEINFVGTIQNRNNLLKDNFIKSVKEKTYELIRKNGISDIRKREMRKFVNEFAEAQYQNFSFVDEKTIGLTMYKKYAKDFNIEKWIGISLNEKYASNYDNFVHVLKEAVQSKFHPIGCDTIKSVVDHEIGHILDDLLGISSDKYIKELYGKNTPNQMTESLSEYAWNNTTEPPIKEFIAEAWSEYKNNPNPRELARKVGDFISKRYEEWKR